MKNVDSNAVLQTIILRALFLKLDYTVSQFLYFK